MICNCGIAWKYSLNPFKPNGLSYSYQLAQSISVLRVVGCYFSFLFKFEYTILEANSGDSDQTPQSAASDMGLHCLPISHKNTTHLL